MTLLTSILATASIFSLNQAPIAAPSPLALTGFESASVAVMPILNSSGDKWKDLKDRQIAKSHEWLATEFASRGFDVIGMPTVLDAIKESKIDFSDEEEWKRASIFQIGKAVNAHYVLFAVITSTDQKKQNRTFYTDIEGMAEIKIWLLDCKTDTPIMSAKTFVGRSGGNRVGDGKGSNRQIQAAANAFDVALKDFFKDFPKIKR